MPVYEYRIEYKNSTSSLEPTKLYGIAYTEEEARDIFTRCPHKQVSLQKIDLVTHFVDWTETREN